jgi:hypothetical protein
MAGIGCIFTKRRHWQAKIGLLTTQEDLNPSPQPENIAKFAADGASPFLAHSPAASLEVSFANATLTP